MDLQAWNTMLFEHLVKGHASEERLFLYVDRAVLAEVSGLAPHDAVADFCESFRSWAGSRPFARAVRDALAWRARDWKGEPPIVAALSMTVLAVTEDPIGNPAGVYRTQNHLLGLTADAVEPDGYGDHVPVLWKVWNQWLQGPGSRFGQPSARTEEHRRYQGWARSQGLIRFRDRLLVEEFVTTVRADVLSRTSVDALAGDLFTWLAFRGDRGSGLLNKVVDPALRPIICDVLEDEVRRLAEQGRRARATGANGTLRALLSFDEFEQVFFLTVRVHERLVGRTVTVDGATQTIDEFSEYLTVHADAMARDVLNVGTSGTLDTNLAWRFTSEPVYLMRAEPLVEGLLQVRGEAAATRYSILAREDRSSRILEALESKSISPTRASAPVEGWVWLHNVPPVADISELSALGLGFLAPPARSEARLHGGLQVGPDTYLVGFEPDLLLPQTGEVDVRVDGVGACCDHDGVVRLSRMRLPAGEHRVAAGVGPFVKLNTVDHMRERATGSDITMTTGAAGLATRDCPSGGRWSGALCLDGDVPRLPLLRRLPGLEYLVLLEEGELVQVQPAAEEGWLSEVGLQGLALDMDRAVAGLSRPAFLLSRNARSGQVHAVEVPHPERTRPGRVTWTARPDLVSQVITAWLWVGDPAEDRRRHVLERALRPRAGARPPTTGRGGQPRHHTLRVDVVPGVVGNPYDDLLMWLSELETCSAPLSRVLATWSWICDHHGRSDLSDHGRLALFQLERLGHIERDHRRQRVGAAAPSLVDLPQAEGLKLLVGARPRQLLARLGATDDHDEVLSDALMEMVIHRRIQLGRSGEPAAPTTLLIEANPAKSSVIAAGLERLGVETAGAAGPELLARHPDLPALVQRGQRLTTSPSRVFRHRLCRPNGSIQWTVRRNDAEPGLYEYAMPQGKLYAWRDHYDGSLSVVDRNVGIWLDEADGGRRRHVKHFIIGRQLAVPADRGLPLPTALDRALTLRTGLPPRHIPPRDEQWLRASAHWVYENVDIETAERIGAILGQDIVPVPDTIKVAT